MIKLIRLDERLIHGQVAIKWSRHVGVDRIVVANADAAANEFVQQSLMMAAPPTAKVAIKDIPGAVELLSDPRAAQLKILVVVATPDDLLSLVTRVPGIAAVNIGNYGRVAARTGDTPRRSFGANLYLYPAEVEVLREVVATGIPAVVQTTPEDSPLALGNVLSNH